MYSGAFSFPVPSNITYLWGVGSLLSLTLCLQLVTGLFLAMHYNSSVELAFKSVIYINSDVTSGWIIRMMHANGASLFFMLMYTHIGRGLYYGGYNNSWVWSVGVSMYLVSMALAFLGYVLPWGQMSYWGATVITNLLSSIPYIGTQLVHWVWGGFSVSGPTLSRFFALHFTLPFLLSGMVLAHILLLHEGGSSSSLGISKWTKSVGFGVYFGWKDLVGMCMVFFFFFFFCMMLPYYWGDSDNFIMADFMVTPIHIKPEWYFLFAYAILRTIPSKGGGVLALLMSVIVLYFYGGGVGGCVFNPLAKFLFWCIVFNMLMLSWLGGCVVEYPYIIVSSWYTFLYFFSYGLFYVSEKMWGLLMSK